MLRAVQTSGVEFREKNTWELPVSICPASGFFFESTPGDDMGHGNFEVLTLRDGTRGLVHWWRDNNADGYPWTRSQTFGSEPYTAASFCEGDYKTHESNGQWNFESLERYDRHGPITVFIAPGLDQAWRENGGNWDWHGPTATAISGGIVNPSIASVRHRPDQPAWPQNIGNLYAVIPRSNGGFDFCIRDQPNYDWRHFTAPAAGSVFQGASFLLSFVRSGATEGSAESGDRVVAAVSEAGALELYIYRGMGGTGWEGPFIFGRNVMEGKLGPIFIGRPSIIMSDFNEDIPGDWALSERSAHYGNYELIAPLKDGGIAHFYKDNGHVYGGVGVDLSPNEIQNAWSGYDVFGKEIYSEVSMIQSNLGSGDNGHLEVVARRHDQTGFDFYWRDDDLVTWHGPDTLG
jgi:hypothetical protein